METKSHYMSRRGNILNVFSGLAGWILLNYVTIKRLLLCVFLLQFQTKELLQSSQMLLVVEIMLQQLHVLHTNAHNPIKHPSLKLKTCYKSLHNIDLFSIAFSAACSVAKQRVATLLTWRISNTTTEENRVCDTHR